MDAFQYATRAALRFSSPQGDLTVEQLWDLPLDKPNKPTDLNRLAQGVNRALKELGNEESFVSSAKKPKGTKDLEVKLEVLKAIIAVKQDELAAGESRAASAAEIERLQELIDKKKDAELEGLSVEQLQERLATLRSAQA